MNYDVTEFLTLYASKVFKNNNPFTEEYCDEKLWSLVNDGDTESFNELKQKTVQALTQTLKETFIANIQSFRLIDVSLHFSNNKVDFNEDEINTLINIFKEHDVDFTKSNMKAFYVVDDNNIHYSINVESGIIVGSFLTELIDGIDNENVLNYLKRDITEYMSVFKLFLTGVIPTKLHEQLDIIYKTLKANNDTDKGVN